MTTSHRDLAQPDPWRRSIERSLHRRSIAPQIRRAVARRRRASVALSTLMVAGPTGSLLAAAGIGLGGRGVDVAQASPASRAIDNGATPAAMAFKLGSRGDAVAEIQRQLGVPVDGIFGPVTQAAVTDFQARNGLDVDGIVGPVTWTALFGLEQAAAAAGARDGSVAVVLRERTDGAADAGTALAARPASDDVGGKGPLSDPVGDDPVALGVPDDIPPPTKPVSAPPPANGVCGPLRLASPVKGMVTSGYGPRWGRNHDGLDIAAPTGTPIRAAECGIVSFSGVQGGYGNMVCVKHSSRFETCYAHMTKYAVSAGQRVDRGQVIGYVGCTGSCTGPHLHFETRVDGSARDPRPYLTGGSVPGAPTVKAAASTNAKQATAATIARDVEHARFTKTRTDAAPQASTAWSPAEGQTVGGTGRPTATTPGAAAPTASGPTDTVPPPMHQTPPPAPPPAAPDTTAPSGPVLVDTAPQPGPPAPAPESTYVAPAAATSPPMTTAPPVEPPPAPVPPIDPKPTPIPPIETPPTDPLPSPDPEPAEQAPAIDETTPPDVAETPTTPTAPAAP